MTDAGGRGRMSRGRGQTPWIAPESDRPAIRCPLCGAVNSGPTDFCRWCGTPLGRSTDPVLGTTTRRTIEDRRSNPLGALFGALAAAAVLAVTGWLLLTSGVGGLLGGDAASATPTGSASVSPTGTPAGSPGSGVTSTPGISPTLPTVEPATPSPAPTSSPQPTPSPEPTLPPTETGFTCERATIADPNAAAWRVDNLTWLTRGRTDELQIILDLTSEAAARNARVDIESVESSEVPDLTGLDQPTTDRALVITMRRPIRLRVSFTVEPGQRVIREVQVDDGADGRVYAVVGVVGDGCYSLQAPEWDQGAPPDTSTLVLNVRR